METWKKIENYDDYSVSNLGNVRIDISTRQHDKGDLLKHGKASSGQARVTLRKDGIKSNHMVHNLVGRAFVKNKDPENTFIGFIDGDPLNFAASNLRWVSKNEIMKNYCDSQPKNIARNGWRFKSVDERGVKWKRMPIKSVEKIYSVSELGEVRADVDRLPIRAGELLSITEHKAGFPLVSLTVDGKQRAFMLNHLVADAFLKQEKGRRIVFNKDNDRKNCKVKNLVRVEDDYTKRMPVEIPKGNWKPVNLDPFRKDFMICDDGRVMRVTRGPTASPRMLEPQIGDNGYVYVSLCSRTKARRCLLHRLLALTFIPNPHNKPHVNHLNGRRDDFSLKNLEWCTQSENMQHASTELRKYRWEPPAKSIEAMRSLHKAGQSYKEIAEIFGVLPNKVQEWLEADATDR